MISLDTSHNVSVSHIGFVHSAHNQSFIGSPQSNHSVRHMQCMTCDTISSRLFGIDQRHATHPKNCAAVLVSIDVVAIFLLKPPLLYEYASSIHSGGGYGDGKLLTLWSNTTCFSIAPMFANNSFIKFKSLLSSLFHQVQVSISFSIAEISFGWKICANGINCLPLHPLFPGPMLFRHLEKTQRALE